MEEDLEKGLMKVNQDSKVLARGLAAVQTTRERERERGAELHHSHPVVSTVVSLWVGFPGLRPFWVE